MQRLEKESVEVINTELVFPSHTNHYGTIFGGRLLELMDMTGGLAAMRFACEEVVTASVEALDFKMPVKLGDIVELRANVIYTARTSMVVKVDVFRIGKFNSKRDFCCRGFFIFVAVDANGYPKAIPSLKLVSDEDRRFWNIGEAIRNRAIERQKSKED
ncbi:MAG TPA: acyl-CoA thioesterase [Thermodesulfobacteriota bacterium]|nr:acyl-CoA thioesterase [Thermodesulfobacteriota bacterium]